MKIYLAGKVDAEHGSWRDAILGKVYDPIYHCEHPTWELFNHHGTFDVATESYNYGHVEPPEWPQTPNNFVLGIHEYVGPYRLTYPDASTKSSGYFHGTTWLGQHGMMDSHQSHIFNECRRAIQRSDFIFAYINSPDCFGTIAEIGMAYTLGKYVALVVDDSVEWDWTDYWFIHQLASYVDHKSWEPQRFHSGIPSTQSDEEFIRAQFRDALVHWTGRKPERALAVVPANREQAYIDEFVRYGSSFSQIERWTSDPRVRAEAAKMVARVRQVVGR